MRYCPAFFCPSGIPTFCSQSVCPSLTSTGTTGEGVGELWEAIARHRGYLVESGLLERRRADRLAHELRQMLLARSALRIEELAAGEEFATAVKALAAGELDPYQAADRLLAR